MKMKYRVLIFSILILLIHFNISFANESSSEVSEDQKIIALKKLQSMSNEKGDKLQKELLGYVYYMDIAYQKEGKTSDIELSVLLMVDDICEQFYLHRTSLILFINSNLEPYNDRLNKKILYNLLLLRSPKPRIQNYYKEILSNSERIENKEFLIELDKAKKVIPLIITEIDSYKSVLEENFGHPFDYLEDEVVDDLHKSVTINSSEVKRDIQHFNARLRPYFSDGEYVGIVLKNIQSDSIFNHMKLKDNDIILGFDGKSLTNDADSFEFYNALESKSEITLEIRRDTILKTVKYKFE